MDRYVWHGMTYFSVKKEEGHFHEQITDLTLTQLTLKQKS